MIPAVQARRRASAAEMRPPVSRVQTPAWSRSASSCSRVMVTTTVAEQPPVLGRSLGGEGLEQLGQGDAVADRGGQVGVDARRARRRWRSATGEEIARIILVSICPCSAGMRKRSNT